ncbi:predicted protein [Aspergillus terreus NIH2624]|uniref:Serine hydrolase domain-containing protein n=1 Tax=Aspergillus terreus (strain NIH 2624 / FGSC A1156) TaxID=341663 RepID=Q0CGX6_ASPTN|nr:uncharacterized protein ATEG_07066 [Aspergillus terreus NIH2624]EAU32450.1 predicted protein [Aspergillus terreus NIH2624]
MSQTFKAQLGPLVKLLEKPGSIEFKWIDGFYTTEAPPTFGEYFGTAPHFRFFPSESKDFKDDPISSILNCPKGVTAEDTLRMLHNSHEVSYSQRIQPTMDMIFRVLEDDPEIEHATFFAGWPPFLRDNNSTKFALADECDDVITVPTCHVVGCNDPYIDAALALYSMCDEDTATLFDHGKGHTVPRDMKTMQELVSAIQDTWSKAEKRMSCR